MRYRSEIPYSGMLLVCRRSIVSIIISAFSSALVGSELKSVKYCVLILDTGPRPGHGSMYLAPKTDMPSYVAKSRDTIA